MERSIDFSRNRHMLCGHCGHHWVVDLNWINRWEDTQETCPGCNSTVEEEDSPHITVDPNDPALTDTAVVQMNWYHTSSWPNWPPNNFDPAATLTEDDREVMGGDCSVNKWADDQRAKALHVGTYEAAIHNMLRRRGDEADHSTQFYLYRVRLKPTATVSPGWIQDPGNFVGDAPLKEVCPPGTDVTRYLNNHEDPGGLSLVLGRTTIASVQRLQIPIPGIWDDTWVHTAVVTIDTATPTTNDRGPEPTDPLGRMRWRRGWPQRSPKAEARNELAESLATQLPINLRDQFTRSAVLVDEPDPTRWARYTSSLYDLITAPGRVLELLDAQDERKI